MKDRQAKILVFDIETSLNKIEHFTFYNAKYPIKIPASSVKNSTRIHCIGYKWLHEKKSHVISNHDFTSTFKKDPLNDIKVLMEFSKVLKEADAVIGHNMKSFDLPHINARLMLNGLEPLVMPVVIDTLKLARANVNLASFKLDEIARALGLDVRKSPMEFSDWVGCYNGDIKSAKKMAKYCKQDIAVTEAVYYKILPYLKKVPNLPKIMGKTAKESVLECDSCGSKDNIKYGIKGSTTGRYQYRRCKDCGHVFKAEKA